MFTIAIRIRVAPILGLFTIAIRTRIAPILGLFTIAIRTRIAPILNYSILSTPYFSHTKMKLFIFFVYLIPVCLCAPWWWPFTSTSEEKEEVEKEFPPVSLLLPEGESFRVAQRVQATLSEIRKSTFRFPMLFRVGSSSASDCIRFKDPFLNVLNCVLTAEPNETVRVHHNTGSILLFAGSRIGSFYWKSFPPNIKILDLRG